MNTTKIITILIADAILLIFAGLGVAGLLGWITMSQGLAITSIIGPCLGAAGTIYGAKHIFEDPDAVAKLKQKHSDEILHLNDAFREQHAAAMAKSESAHQEALIKKDEIIAQRTKENERLSKLWNDANREKPFMSDRPGHSAGR